MSDNDHSAQLPIAVVGVSTLMPGSQDVAGFWHTLVEGRDLIRDVPETHWLIDDYYDQNPMAEDKTYGRRGAFLDPVEFDTMAFGIPPSTVEATDTAQLLALVVARNLLDDATGGHPETLDRSRTGVILGVAPLDLPAAMNSRIQRPVWLKVLREKGIDEPTAQAICQGIADSYVPWQEGTFPGLLSNVVAGRIANRFDLGGVNYTTDAACAGAMAALSSAVAELRLGHADLMITGGVDTLNDILMYMCFSKVLALSPSGDCRPFADNADGTILGEGLAMVALKRLADAERDGDHIYAVLKGVGSSSDGRGTSIFAPVAGGQSRALQRAYRQAGYGPETVELVEAHGTGTNTGDAVELTALSSVFADSGRADGPWCAVGSLKSQFGHTKAAAGAAGLAKAVLALHHKVLPITLKVDRPNKAISDGDGPLYVNTRTRPWISDTDHPRRAGVSSFGFGGTNFHLTLEEYTPAGDGTGQRARLLRTAASELVVLSAPSADELVSACRSVETTDLTDTARRSQAAFRASAAARLAVVAGDTDDLRSKLGRAADLIAQQPGQPFAMPGLRYGIGPTEPGAIAFLFPGQGSQYLNMGADLAMHLPEARRAWDRAAALHFDGLAVHRVTFPVPAFTDEQRTAQSTLLHATEWAQPALAVMSLALLEVLQMVGVQPDCVAGHSFGELVALHAAGAFDEQSLVRLARRRGELMRDASTGADGAMLAVAASADAVGDMLTSSGLEQLWLANHNSPCQTVVSGTETDIDALIERVLERGMSCRRLNTATAFHTPLVAAAGESLREYLDEIIVREPQVDVFGNADAAVYPRDADAVRTRVCEQLAQPVRFADQISAMYERGVRTFVEVGAGATLTGLVSEILSRRPHLAVSLDQEKRNGVTALQDGLGALVVAGVAVDFAPLWSHYAQSTPIEPRKRSMTLPLLGTNYGKRYPPAGGTAALPPANPVRDAAVTGPLSEPVTEAVPDSGAQTSDAAGVSSNDDEWLRAFQHNQQLTTDAHLAFQRVLADTHLAYLKSMEMADVPEGEPMYPPIPASPAAIAVGHGSPVGAAPMHEHTPAPVIAAPSAEPGTAMTPAPITTALPVVTEATAVAPPSKGELEQLLLNAVADATGYPVSMLDPSMELEGDLGIDSIKRVQILSALRDAVPDLPSVDISELGQLRSLGDIVERIRASDGIAGELPAGIVTPDPVASDGQAQRAPIHSRVRAVPMAAADLALGGLYDGPLVVVEDNRGIAAHVAAKLVALGLDARVVRNVPADTWGVIDLSGASDVATVDDAIQLNRRVFATARTVAASFTERGGVFVTVQDTGGDFGLGGRDAIRAWSGGIGALARTAAKEWNMAAVKAIDCERGTRDPGTIAAVLVDELVHGGAGTDVGLRADGTRVGLHTIVADADHDPKPVIDRSSVIVATGGGRGVTAATLRALAAAHRPRIVLIGRSSPADEDLSTQAATDEPTLRRIIVGQLTADGKPRPAPAQVDATVDRVLAAREIRATLGDLEAAGSEVRYLALDIRNAELLVEALDAVRRDWGPITGIVHGAGVLADKRIVDKSDDQFNRVFDTKVEGLRTLLDATADDPLALLCLFSSAAARFGNVGQADYAMANDILGHVAHVLHNERPDCRVRAICWGPWRGGMVDALIAAHFESRGVRLLSLEAGAAGFLRELDDAGSEVGIGISADGPDDPLGHGPDRADRATVRVGRATHPHLADHTIVDTPVLPMAMALEWFDALAREHTRNTGTLTIRDITVLRPVTLHNYADAGQRLHIRGLRTGPRTLPLELRTDDGNLCYRASVDLTGNDVTEALWSAEPPELPPPADDRIYDGRVLFHGPRWHCLRRLVGLSTGGAAAVIVGARELDWPAAGFSGDPAAVDGGLQLALLWAHRALGRATLPMTIGRYRIYRPGPLSVPVRAWILPRRVDDYSAVCDIRFGTETGEPWAELAEVSLVVRPDGEQQ